MSYAHRQGLRSLSSGKGTRLRRHGDRLSRQEQKVRRMRRHQAQDRKSTRLNSSHSQISYAVFCLKKNHACGYDNSATEFCCGNPSCRAAIRLQLVTTTQYLPPANEQDADRVAIELVRESYLVAAL